MEKCSECASFAQDGRVGFEEALDVRTVHPWNCDDPTYRALVMDAGVTDLPAYVIVPTTGPPRVITP